MSPIRLRRQWNAHLNTGPFDGRSRYAVFLAEGQPSRLSRHFRIALRDRLQACGPWSNRDVCPGAASPAAVAQSAEIIEGRRNWITTDGATLVNSPRTASRTSWSNGNASRPPMTAARSGRYSSASAAARACSVPTGVQAREPHRRISTPGTLPVPEKPPDYAGPKNTIGHCQVGGCNPTARHKRRFTYQLTFSIAAKTVQLCHVPRRSFSMTR